MNSDELPPSGINRKILRQALKDWHSLKSLGEHPLTDLALVRSELKNADYTDTVVGRGLALRTILHAAVDALKPEGILPESRERPWRLFTSERSREFDWKNPPESQERPWQLFTSERSHEFDWKNPPESQEQPWQLFTSEQSRKFDRKNPPESQERPWRLFASERSREFDWKNPPEPQERPWRPYVILSEQYLNGHSPDWIMAQLHVSRTTYFSEQRRALDLLADVLQTWEEDRRASHSTPSPPSAPPIPFLAPPRPPHALVGRDDLLDKLKQQLMNGRSCALTALNGLPGIGKTTLAIALAHDPAIRNYFPDGVLWAGLSRHPNLLFWLGIWAAAVGIPEEAIARYADIPQRAAAVHAAIGLRRMLLVIDNAWQTKEALTFKVGGPNCAHLLTTRLANVALDFAGEEVVLVRELSPAQGLDLLAEIAPRAVKAAPQQAQELTQMVGGLPLAIILMGNYLRKESHSDQPRRLHDALSHLRAAEARLQLTQPQSPLEASTMLQSGASLSLQAAIDLSRASLDPAAERALFNLSLFMPKPNTFPEAAALAVTGSTVDVLDTLVDHGLLESVAPNRYTIHQTIADYAALRGAEVEAFERFVKFFVQYIEEKQGENDLLERELANIFTALDDARSAFLHTWLVRCVHALHLFLETRGLYQLDEQYLGWARRAAKISGDMAALAYNLRYMGDLRIKIGQFRQAQEFLQESIHLAEHIGDRKIEGQGLMDLGLACWYRSGRSEDRQYFERARQCFQEIGDLDGEGYALNGLGYARIEQGKFEAAKTYLDQALRVCRMGGNRRGEGWAHYHLGTAYLPLGEFDRALSHWEQCRAIYLELEERRGEGWIVYSLGRYHRQTGEYAQARQSFERARDMFEEIGEQFGLGFAIHNLGLVCNDLGEYKEAETHFDAALALFQALENRVGENSAFVCLGITFRQLGDYQGARDYLERAMAVFSELDLDKPRGLCKTQANLGLICLYQGQYATAQSYCQQALQLANDIGARPTQAYALTFFGHVLFGTEQISEAEEMYRQAAAIRLELGQPHRALDPQAGLAQTLLAQGEVDRAQEVVDTMLDYIGNLRSLPRLERALAGTDAPSQILQTCYEVLHACHDPREQSALHAADLVLHARADRIDNHVQRQLFLDNTYGRKDPF